MKKILELGMILVLMITMVACGKDTGPTKEDLQRENSAMLSLLKENEDKIKSLEDTLKALSGEVNTAIGYMDGGAGKQSFYTINDKVIFPVPFEYKGTTQAPNTAGLSITQNVVVSPSNNWLIKINGTTGEFYHPSNITGVIRVGNIQQAIHADKVQEEVFKPFIDSIPHGNVVYGKLFLDSNCWGNHATIITTVNEKNAVLKAGALGIGNISITYMFYYDGDRDSTKDELIDNLVKTMKVNSQQLSFN